MPPLGQSSFQFLESQAASIEASVRMVEYATIQYPDLTPIDRTHSPDADVIIYYSGDAVGSMTEIGNMATDIPLINVTTQQHQVGIEAAGLAYGWTDREIARARRLGESLNDKKVRAAFRIAEEYKEKIFLYGHAGYGWDGFLAAGAETAISTPWNGATAEDDETIFQNVNDLLTGVWTGTNQVRIANTLLLSPTLAAFLGRPMGNDAARSVLAYIRENNIYTQTTGQPLLIRVLRELGDADQDRDVMAYDRSEDVLRFHVLQELTFLPPQRKSFGWVYHGSVVLGGLEVMEPTAVRSLTGVLAS